MVFGPDSVAHFKGLPRLPRRTSGAAIKGLIEAVQTKVQESTMCAYERVYIHIYTDRHMCFQKLTCLLKGRECKR